VVEETLKIAPERESIISPTAQVFNASRPEEALSMSVQIAPRTISSYPPRRATHYPDVENQEELLTLWKWPCYRIAGPRHWRNLDRWLSQVTKGSFDGPVGVRRRS